jgi:fatty-acyl-CoA synthase
MEAPSRSQTQASRAGGVAGEASAARNAPHWIEATTLGDLLGRRAAEQGERTAIAFPDHQMTYAGLAARADFFARGMLAQGIRPGETVGILLPNCVDSIAALFGAAKIGVLPVPVNGRFKSVELSEVIRHSRMRMLFTSPQAPGAPDFQALLTEAFPHLAEQDSAELTLPGAPDLRQIVVLGGDRSPGFSAEAGFASAGEAVDGAEVWRRQQLVKVRDPAVVMYTSGTAAAPKGALLSHEALVRFASGTTQTRFFLTPEDRIWTALPMFHIGGIAFAVASIYAGATYCHPGHFQPRAALDQIETLRSTIVLAAFETIWLPVVNLPDFSARDLSSVRIVMAVGVPERLRDMAGRLPHAVQVSCFGMTEASSFLSLNYLSDGLEQRVATGGHPMPGMECRVVDPVTGLDLPPGTQGELLFRGSNCFTGYLNDQELTAQVFDGEGWFHTGDVAEMDAEGRVTFISRLKDMLKVGGENVAAAEVEGYLLRHPDVSIAQVVAAPDDYYVEVPAAFLELKPGATISEEEIIAFCVGKIATFRVPRYVRFVTEWPMSGTKIKKTILREMIAAELTAKRITRAPKVQPNPGQADKPERLSQPGGRGRS